MGTVAPVYNHRIGVANQSLAPVLRDADLQLADVRRPWYKSAWPRFRGRYAAVIIETIVTTVAPDGPVNYAPMGVEWGDDTIVLKPFLETATYANLLATRVGVVNITDDVGVFARAAIENPSDPTIPARVVRGVVLADCCSWREVEVRTIDSSPPRARMEAFVVHKGSHRDFIGFNRARSAVLEATIYATRLHLLSAEFVRDELERLQVIVDKTAGPAELEAMTLITDHVRSVSDSLRGERN